MRVSRRISAVRRALLSLLLPAVIHASPQQGAKPQTMVITKIDVAGLVRYTQAEAVAAS
jgi:hypothetical protein